MKPKGSKLSEEKTIISAEYSVGMDFINKNSFRDNFRLIIDKLDHIKLKICAANETISQATIQPTGWERILSSYISEKRLISRLHREV